MVRNKHLKQNIFLFLSKTSKHTLKSYCGQILSISLPYQGFGVMFPRLESSVLHIIIQAVKQSRLKARFRSQWKALSQTMYNSVSVFHHLSCNILSHELQSEDWGVSWAMQKGLNKFWEVPRKLSCLLGFVCFGFLFCPRFLLKYHFYLSEMHSFEHCAVLCAKPIRNVLNCCSFFLLYCHSFI